MLLRIAFVALLSAVLLLTACGNAASGETPDDPTVQAPRTYSGPDTLALQETLRNRLDQEEASDLPFDGSRLESVREVYAGRDYRPIWTGSSEGLRRAEDLLREVARADRHALNPGSYDLQSVRDALERAYGDADAADREDALARAELVLSDLFLTFGRDLANGPFSPQSVGADWHVASPDANVTAALREAANGDVQQRLTRLASTHEGYGRLQEALTRYEEIAASGGFPTVPEGDVIEEGDEDSRVPTLRERLAAEGFEARAPSEPEMFDESLASALADFQRTRGLAVDSVLGPNTRSALNRSAAERAQQIRANLVRWQWLPSELGGRYILVNLPAFQLTAYEDGEEALSMPVVIGAEFDERATPVFSDSVTYAQFRPYWNVPTDIARDELVPEGADYLRANNFEIVRNFRVGPNDTLPMTQENLQAVAEGRYFLREQPNPSNALGRVKYMFPNEFAIYLHDSPEEHLFEERERAYSHGCIRVEDPAALGAFIFQERGWSEADVRRRMESGPDNERVDLREPLPVFIVYLSAYVPEDGQIHFRDDLYGYDEPILAALAEQGATRPDVRVERLVDLLPR